MQHLRVSRVASRAGTSVFHADKERDWRITTPGVAEAVADLVGRASTS